MPDGAKELHQNGHIIENEKMKTRSFKLKKDVFLLHNQLYICGNSWTVCVFLAHIPICRVILPKEKKKRKDIESPYLFVLLT